MTEQLLNTIIGKSLDFYHKIGDAGKFKKPFDGFGVYRGKPVFWEAKLLKAPLAFNFKRLEDHQIENLLKLQSLLGRNAHVLIIFCVDFGRADKRVYVYNDMQQILERKLSSDSITKKEWVANENYARIKKGLIEFEGLIDDL